MDVGIVAALIGAVGSIIAASVGALIAQRGGTGPSPTGSRRPARNDARAGSSGRIGFASLLTLAAGGFLFFTGFALVGYVVLRFITTIFASLQSGSSSPPDLSSIPFTQFLPVGFGLAFAGIVVLALAAFVTGLTTMRR